MRVIFQAAFFFFCVTWGAFTYAALPIADSQGKTLPSLAPMLKNVTPAVVNIAVSSSQTVNNPLLNDPFFRHFFGLPNNGKPIKRQSRSVGSGVIIDANKGLILTNHHVVDHADTITVSLSDGRSFEAKLIGSDAEVDVAVLKIEAKNLTALPMADSSQLQVGDFVVAIGNPFALGQTVTTGVVSALGRTGLNMEHYENFIQTDASINPGNSGGALVNLRGELVGINTAIIAPAGGNVGIGFAIPSNMALASQKQIVKYGKVERGQIGVMVQNLNADLAKAFALPETQRGALISQVQKHSAAEKAGLKAEDVIISLDGKTIHNVSELRNGVAMKRIGDWLKIGYLREGKLQQAKLQILGQNGNTKVAQEKDKPAQLKALSGVSLQETAKGIVVVDIQAEAKAAQMGLQKNDIIVAVNRQTVKDIKQLKKALTKGSADNTLLEILRGGTHLYLVIR